MKSYRHILVLIHDERDGLPLLRQTVAMVRGLPIAITVGHLNPDYAELEYGSDALVKDRQAQEVIATKAMLSRLVSAVDAPVAVKEIVTIRRFKDVSDFIHQAGIDLVVVGHQNRLFGLYSSYSLEFVNRLDVDVLVKHLARESRATKRTFPTVLPS
ncbi:universal stress protein [Serratia marcescens]|uniref:universal stress protein n=1 Tax=Serratia nevei TaxID=2703794 RepID=UPI0018D88C2F|nr:universal stress protein [Serratia marcescens]MBH2804905.1 universal stress protein [Serratia marcescens]MBN5235296.1 universal stress protein [Serratia marcescens]